MIRKLFNKYNSLSSVVRAGLWFTICNFLQKGISFITVPIFTRIMSTEEYGLYSIYLSWYDIITIFATLHLSYYVFNKGLVKFEEDKDRFAVSLQSLSATITVAFIAIYLVLKDVINPLIGLTTPLMLCLLLHVFFEPPILYWVARKRFEYKYQAVITATIAIAVLNPLLGIILIKTASFGSSAFARAVSIVIVSAIFGICLGAITIKKHGKLFSTHYWKYALNFNLPLIPHYLSTTILSQADRIMIGNMCGNTEAAIYSVAYAIGMVCTLFSQAVLQAYLPWLYKKLKASNYEGIISTTNTFLIGMISVLLVLICFAPEIVLIVGSEAYRAAIYVIPPICCSVFFIFLQNLFANIEYYFEKTKLIAAASIGVAVLNVVLNYIFIKTFGYVAAGYTTLACYLVYSIVHFFVTKGICKANKVKFSELFDMKIITSLSAGVIGIAIVMALVYRVSILRYTILAILALIVVLNRKRIVLVFDRIRKKDGDTDETNSINGSNE